MDDALEPVLKAIPHRPPFLFVDAVESVTETGAICSRTLRPDEAFFEGHYPGNPLTPGVLLCEAVFQTGAIFLSHRLAKEGKDLNSATPVLSRIQDARFKQMVKPGDTVTLEVTLKEIVSKFFFLKGTVRKTDGKTAVTLEFALAMVEEVPASS
ncbi:MAG: 3-hydroxyacyl-ACP dehydratase FabZ family protein [Opitutales bacterium]